MSMDPNNQIQIGSLVQVKEHDWVGYYDDVIEARYPVVVVDIAYGFCYVLFGSTIHAMFLEDVTLCPS